MASDPRAVCEARKRVGILAGIDEAGYGPVLGPLVVTATVFEVPDDSLGRCLWDTLRGGVTRPPARKRDSRLVIGDSKRLYRGRSGLAALERPALVMARAAGISASDTRGLLERIAPGILGDAEAYPWYRDFHVQLPVSTTAADVSVRSHGIRRVLDQSGVRVVSIQSELLLEGHFNRLVDRTRNKAVASLGLVLRLVDRIRSAAGSQPARICIDRQGGRTHYASSLMTAFPHCRLRILEESERRCAYHLGQQPRPAAVEFVTSGEDLHLPIALAGIVSKYLRELFMQALNRYWAARVDGLRPTAGYYEDGHRFLADIEPALQREGLNRGLLVRSR